MSFLEQGLLVTSIVAEKEEEEEEESLREEAEGRYSHRSRSFSLSHLHVVSSILTCGVGS